MICAEELDAATRALLARLKAFCFPGGEEAARHVRVVRTKQRGEFRATLSAKAMAFTADEMVDSTCSSFRWNARIGPVVVTDAYERGHGWLATRLGGILPLKKATGPDFDKGELQRYLASALFCPPMLLNHGSLECTAVGTNTLRLRDRQDATGASIDLQLDDEGQPLIVLADRPRTVGKESVLTPWTAGGHDFREWEGLRVPAQIEVSWHLPEGTFTYFRAEITSFQVVR